MKDWTRKVVAIAGDVLCIVAALLPVPHMPIIGAVPWSFFDGKPRKCVFAAAAGGLAMLLGLLGHTRGWNLIPAYTTLAVAIAGIVSFTDMLEELRTAIAEEDLGMFEGFWRTWRSHPCHWVPRPPRQLSELSSSRPLR